MNNVICNRRPTRVAKGFTQVELLVIVAVVGVLAMVGISGARKWSNQSKIAQCSNNLRQLNMSQLLYGADNLDNLPSINPGGANWLWDTPVSVTSTFLRYGVATNMMYCPGTSPRFTDAQNFASSQSLWNFGVPTIRLLGYALSLAGPSLLNPTNRNTTTVPQPMTIGGVVIPAPLPSQRVLTADAILTTGGGNFTSIFGGYTYNGASYPHLCPHLDGNYPAGGNVAMLDGHVEWRPFQQMSVRTTSLPSFYW